MNIWESLVDSYRTEQNEVRRFNGEVRLTSRGRIRTISLETGGACIAAFGMSAKIAEIAAGVMKKHTSDDPSEIRGQVGPYKYAANAEHRKMIQRFWQGQIESYFFPVNILNKLPFM